MRTAVDEILLKSEFEAKKDIRDYLRKWLERQDNSADPVCGPGTTNPTKKSDSWVGNMLNDSREAYDAGGDRERAEEEDSSDLFHDMDEGHDMKAFLEPGDLVGLQS